MPEAPPGMAVICDTCKCALWESIKTRTEKRRVESINHTFSFLVNMYLIIISFFSLSNEHSKCNLRGRCRCLQQVPLSSHKGQHLTNRVETQSGGSGEEGPSSTVILHHWWWVHRSVPPSVDGMILRPTTFSIGTVVKQLARFFHTLARETSQESRTPQYTHTHGASSCRS